VLKAFRENLGGKLIDGALNSATRVAKVTPGGRAILSGLKVERNISYVNGSREKRHRLDVYQSEDAQGPRPVFIYIHGGGFRILSKDTHWMMTGILAHQGFCVFSINYGLAPEHIYPEGINDVFAAVEWIAEHAVEFGGDLNHIVVGGESAGANLTCGVALAHTRRSEEPEARRIYDLNLKIKALAPACGLLEVANPSRFDILEPDMLQLYRDRLAVICRSYVSEAHASDPLASPLLWLESDAQTDRDIPPTFVGVGDRDPVVSDSTRLVDVLERRGIPSRGVVYPGAIHAFQAFFWQPNAVQFWTDQLEFLAQYVPGLKSDFPR
jgi:acetyl esterase